VLCSQIALVSRGSPLQFGARMSRTKRPRQQCQVSLGILREVETDRVVQTMDANDRALYRVLSQQIIPKQMNGIAAHEPLGETGYAYVAGLQCRDAS